jgi:hypothetical protein
VVPRDVQLILCLGLADMGSLEAACSLTKSAREPCVCCGFVFELRTGEQNGSRAEKSTAPLNPHADAGAQVGLQLLHGVLPAFDNRSEERVHRTRHASDRGTTDGARSTSCDRCLW